MLLLFVFGGFLNKVSKVVGALFKDESCQVMGAMFEVYREMECGFLGPVYQVHMRELFDRSSER